MLGDTSRAELGSEQALAPAFAPAATFKDLITEILNPDLTHLSLMEHMVWGTEGHG